MDKALERASEYRLLAQQWRDRAGNAIEGERQLSLEIAGQYDKLAAQLERAARLFTGKQIASGS